MRVGYGRNAVRSPQPSVERREHTKTKRKMKMGSQHSPLLNISNQNFMYPHVTPSTEAKYCIADNMNSLDEWKVKFPVWFVLRLTEYKHMLLHSFINVYVDFRLKYVHAFYVIHVVCRCIKNSKLRQKN